MAQNVADLLWEMLYQADRPAVLWHRLQLGRSYAMAGDTAKAKSAYDQFFSIWKDADSDLSVLRQAKSEYIKLH